MMTQLSNTWANGLASAKRINEVLDAVPEVARGAPTRCPCRGQRGERGRASARVDFHYNGERGPRRAGGHLPRGRGGPDHRHPGRDGLGQDEPRQPDPALLRRHRGARCGSTASTCDGSQRGLPPRARRHRPAGDHPLLGHGARQHPLRPPRGERGGGGRRGQGGRRPTTSSCACPRATTPASRSGASTSREGRSSASRSPAPSSRGRDPHPGRQHQRRGRRDRDEDPGRPRPAPGRLHLLRRGAAHQHRAQRGQDRRARRGRVVAEGRHAELLQTSPIYREIYDSQLGGGIHES